MGNTPHLADQEKFLAIVDSMTFLQKACEDYHKSTPQSDHKREHLLAMFIDMVTHTALRSMAVAECDGNTDFLYKMYAFCADVQWEVNSFVESTSPTCETEVQ